MTEPSLAERRRRTTRDEIAHAAIDLFTERGFDNVSMAAVADAAGISRRTLYRYFATKDDLVFEHPRRWLDYFRTTIETRPDDESPRDCLRRAVTEVAEIIQSDPEPVLRSFAVRLSAPALGARHSATDAEWIRIAAELLMANADPANVDACIVAASALTGSTNGLIVTWALHQPRSDLVELTAATLDQIDSIWPAGTR